MLLHVLGQIRALRKRFLTYDAHVRLVRTVDFHVSAQNFRLAKSLLAYLTIELVGVGKIGTVRLILVVGQLLWTVAVHTTLEARERTLTVVVDCAMLLQVKDEAWGDCDEQLVCVRIAVAASVTRVCVCNTHKIVLKRIDLTCITYQIHCVNLGLQSATTTPSRLYHFQPRPQCPFHVRFAPTHH